MLILSVIGCGKVGKALCRVFVESGTFEIGDVLNRRPDSARAAIRFVGGGRPLETWAELGPADVVMLSVPDDAIADCAARLARRNVLAPGAVVFHSSGAKASTLLAELGACGAHVASLHPVKSFADPESAAATFGGTLCALEGDPAACAVLEEAIARAGGRCFRVRADGKLLYHAGTVFASNYLVALLEIATRCFLEAGITRDEALAIALPLARGTLDNVATLGLANGLTGPIARGDSGLVREQLAALRDRTPEIGALYAQLGHYALELAAQRAGVDATVLAELERALEPRR